jgi:iron complex transport system substrate-binding protein
VVVLTQGGAELLLRLGLGDWIVGVGAVSGSVDLEVAEAFSKLTVFSENYIGKEIVLGAQPDLVLGRAPLFAEADWGAGSVDELNRYGIRTYIQNTSRPGAIIEDLYRDITELGQIFDAGERAAIFIEELREREGGLRAAVAANRGPALSYAYLNRIVDGVPNAYAGNKDTFLASAMEILGLVNVFRDAQRDIIDLETLIAADPDMLLWFSYAGGPDVLHLRDELYANAALGGMKSIANRRIYIFDYNEFWGYSYRIFSVLEKLAANL